MFGVNYGVCEDRLQAGKAFYMQALQVVAPKSLHIECLPVCDGVCVKAMWQSHAVLHARRTFLALHALCSYVMSIKALLVRS